MPYIQRAITPILKQRVSTSKCMLLVGARQVGKSTLIKHEFKDFNRANFDDRLTRMQAKEEPKLFFLNNPQPLFIDEVQKVNEFQKAVDSLYIKKNVDLYITGSNANLLSSELATLLSGRYIEIKMLPLSFKEYKDAYPNLSKDNYEE